MDQENTVNKVLRDIQSSFKLSEGAVGVLRIHLGYVYAAGWLEGHKKSIHYANKEVYQCDKEGHIIGVYKSATDAAKQLNCSRDTIYVAIAEKRMTRKGHFWKHKEEVL